MSAKPFDFALQVATTLPAGDVLMMTGGAGFIGSALVADILANTPLYVLNVDALSYAANPKSLPLQHPRHLFAHTSITNADHIAQLFERFKPVGVIHLAAESHVDRAIASAAPFVDTNIVGTHVLLEAALQHYLQVAVPEQRPFKFYYVSTDEVLGALEYPDARFHETSPIRPNNPYAASKAAGEHLVRAMVQTYHFPAIISRCSNNYGPLQHWEKLIPRVVACALKGEPIPVFGAGLQSRDWLHVSDHVRALWLLFERARAGSLYHIGSGKARRNIDVVRKICAYLDELSPRLDGQPHESAIEFVADRLGHDWCYAMNFSRIKRDFSWRPAIDFASGLRDTVAHLVARFSEGTA